MDYQVLFNGAFGLATFLGGWVLNNITKTMQRLDDDVRKLPVTYVAKLDYHRDLHDIKVLLTRIDDKLDSKADRA